LHRFFRGGDRSRCRLSPGIEGHLLSDIVAVIGSINVVAAELDR
jgi:NADH:ubiquinone oxidoreductase subunit D